jgi:hypothetical protein
VRASLPGNNAEVSLTTTIGAKAQQPNESENQSDLPNNKRSGVATSQFGGGIGIRPVTVSAVVVKTAAAILVVTVKTHIKMLGAKILLANST